MTKQLSCEALVEVGGGLARCGKPATHLCDSWHLGKTLVGVCGEAHAPTGRTVSFPIPKARVWPVAERA